MPSSRGTLVHPFSQDRCIQRFLPRIVYKAVHRRTIGRLSITISNFRDKYIFLSAVHPTGFASPFHRFFYYVYADAFFPSEDATRTGSSVIAFLVISIYVSQSWHRKILWSQTFCTLSRPLQLSFSIGIGIAAPVYFGSRRRMIHYPARYRILDCSRGNKSRASDRCKCAGFDDRLHSHLCILLCPGLFPCMLSWMMGLVASLPERERSSGFTNLNTAFLHRKERYSAFKSISRGG